MKRKSSLILSFVVLFFCFNSVFAKKVEIATASQVAINCYVENNLTSLSEKSVSITNQYTVSKDSYALYYVFNFNSGGFAIISADDIVTPVLGYSFEGNYSDNNQSPEFEYWMSTYENQIFQAISTGYIATTATNNEWLRLAKNPSEFTPVKGAKAIAPLLNSTWDQGGCYNDLCPADAASSAGNGKVWAGCVATSMAQVMYYYRYPATGQNSHTYTPQGYTSQTANFGATTYDWNAMTNICSGVNNAIATLLYHCGVSVEMGYSPTGSGAFMNKARDALVSYFKYASSIKFANKDGDWGGTSYTDAEWEALIKTELDANRPVMYAATDPTPVTGGGHAFNCDGYDASSPTKYHFNWGWSGQGNGYFLVNALTPMSDNFSESHQLIYNIYPGSGYPYNCSTVTNNVTSNIGTIQDGSGPSDYQNNDDCSWLIAPTEVIDHLKITFDALSTEATNDVVTIYDGPTNTSPVLGTFSGTTVPTITVTSTSPQVRVTFTTNGSVTSSGWQITYSSVYPVYCTGEVNLTDPSGTLSDGSGVNSYNNNTNCRWLIKPAGASSITLHFIDFNTEAVNDKVIVYNAISGATLATYSGTSIPADVTCPSGQMRVLFHSNTSITSSGWTASYTSSLTGVENYNKVSELSVYPNPASNNLHVAFTFSGEKEADIQLMSITGQVIFSESVEATSSTFNKDIDVSRLARGIYYLKIVTSGETINKKVAIE